MWRIIWARAIVKMLLAAQVHKDHPNEHKERLFRSYNITITCVWQTSAQTRRGKVMDKQKKRKTSDVLRLKVIGFGKLDVG